MMAGLDPNPNWDKLQYLDPDLLMRIRNAYCIYNRTFCTIIFIK
jgi:hypothetical protein